MPTIKERFRCKDCGRRLIRSKLNPTIQYVNYDEPEIRWKCKSECPVKNGHNKKK